MMMVVMGMLLLLTQFIENSACTRDLSQVIYDGQTMRKTDRVCVCVSVYALGCVQLFVTPWTGAHQAPLSMGFPRQEYWR